MKYENNILINSIKQKCGFQFRKLTFSPLLRCCTATYEHLKNWYTNLDGVP